MRFALAFVASAALITALLAALPSSAAQHPPAPQAQLLADRPTPAPNPTLIFRPRPGREPSVLPRSKPAADAPLIDAVAQARAGEPIFHDSFARSFGLWTPKVLPAAAVEIHDGALYITLDGGSTAGTAVAGLVLDDFLLEVDTQRAAGEGLYTANVVFRMSDGPDFYVFQVRSDGAARVGKSRAGEPAELTAPRPVAAFQAGADAVNRLGVAAHGETMAFMINGEVVAQVVDHDLAQGQIGLGANSESPSAVTVTFDNLQVWEAPPLPQPTAAVTPKSVTPTEGPTPTFTVEVTPTPIPSKTPTPVPQPTATRKPVSIETLNIDWRAFEDGFAISNIRLEEHGSTGTHNAVVRFDIEALEDTGIPIFTAEYFDKDGKWLTSSTVTLTPDPAAADRVDFLSQWLKGAYGAGEFELPGSLTRVDKTVIVRVF